MGIADNIMVGKVSTEAVAAVGVCNSIYFTITIIGVGIFSILPPMISRAKAEHNYERCGYLLNNGLLMAFWLGTILMVTTLFTASQFHLFRQEEKVTLLAPGFLRIIGYSALPMFIFLAAKQFTDGLGLTRASMVIAMSAVMMNIGLNYLFIYGHAGFQAMGAEGAAWATFISRCSMAVALILYILYSRRTQPYRPPGFFKNNLAFHREILKDGIPSGFQYLFEIAAFSVASIFMGWINKEASAAHNIVISAAALTYLFVSGIGIGGSIMVSESIGENDRKKAYSYGINAIRIVFFFELFTCALFILMRNIIPEWYNSNEAVLYYAKSLMIIAAVFQIPDGVQCVSLGVLRGMYDVKWPTIFTLVAYWVVALPLSYYLGFVEGFGANGIWTGLTIGLFTSALLLSARYYLIARPSEE
jgi:MATE family multidrug resistance protein